MNTVLRNIIALVSCCSMGVSYAKKPSPQIIAPQDQKILDQQSRAIFSGLDSVSKAYRENVVAIVSGSRQLALGTVIAPHIVLTKLSDLRRTTNPFVAVDHEGKVLNVEPVAILSDHDLMIIYVPGLKSKPIEASQFAGAKLGSIIAAVSPQGKAHDFGVISVEQRSLRPENLPYLGIAIDPKWDKDGIMVAGVEAGGGAHKSGIVAGDVLTKINNKDLQSVLSLKSAMKGVKPGESVTVELVRHGQSFNGELQTGKKPHEMKFPQKRLALMNSMGNRMNERRDDFPLVIQSDMTILPERTGCPVIDLNGKFVGIALSRAGRIETYIIPSWVCKEIIDKVLPEVMKQLEINNQKLDHRQDSESEMNIVPETDRW